MHFPYRTVPYQAGLEMRAGVNTVLVGACIKTFVGVVTADCLGGVIEATPPLVVTPVTMLQLTT